MCQHHRVTYGELVLEVLLLRRQLLLLGVEVAEGALLGGEGVEQLVALLVELGVLLLQLLPQLLLLLQGIQRLLCLLLQSLNIGREEDQSVIGGRGAV